MNEWLWILMGGAQIVSLIAAIVYHERQALRKQEAHKVSVYREAALRAEMATEQLSALLDPPAPKRRVISAVVNWTPDGRYYETNQEYAEPEPLNDAEVDEYLARPRDRHGRWLAPWEAERTKLREAA